VFRGERREVKGERLKAGNYKLNRIYEELTTTSGMESLP
jgi:hypothetical protein